MKLFTLLFVLSTFSVILYCDKARSETQNADDKFLAGLDYKRQMSAFKQTFSSHLIESIQTLEQFRKYNIVDLPSFGEEPKTCKQNIQPLAMSPESLLLGISIVNDFKNDDRLASLPICLSRPIWVNENELNCIFDEVNRRSSCDLTALKDWISNSELSHLALILDEGKAYTYQGIMYLDKQDDYDVFVHELAHFAGFMDEYPLSVSSAKQHCEPVIGVNLIAQNTDGKAIKEAAHLWNKQGVEYTTAESRTCDNIDIITYKASNKLTFMEYHDTGYIPDIYKYLWRYQLNKGYQFNLMRKRLNLPLLNFPFDSTSEKVRINLQSAK